MMLSKQTAPLAHLRPQLVFLSAYPIVTGLLVAGNACDVAG